MNNNMKKILALSVVVMFVFMFATPFVMAADPAPSGEQAGLIKTLWDAFFGGIGGGSFGNMLQTKLGIAGAGDAGYPTIIAFLLLVIIVGMLVYDIADMLPFFSKTWMKGVFAIAFSILAFMFFDMEQVKYLTTTYQAAGIAIVAIIPFIVISAFVWKLDKRAQDETKPAYQMFGTAIWAGFGIYLLLKLQELGGTSADGNPIFMAYMVLTLVALGAVFMHSKVYTWLHKGSMKQLRKMGVKKGEENQRRALRNRIQEINDAMRNPENATDIDKLKELQKEKDSLNKSISVLGG